MRSLSATEVKEAVKRCILETARLLPDDVMQALQRAAQTESLPQGREVLRQLLENAAYAQSSGLPLCQDTGTAFFFVEQGEELRLQGPSLLQILTESTAEAYTEGLLRASLCHPLSRRNSGDNTPVSLHLERVPGDGLHIIFLPKGGGAENMSSLTMLAPAKGLEGVKQVVLDTVTKAGPNPCPPILVGVCVGASFSEAPALAKKALTLPLDKPNPDPEAAALERELLAEINALGIGPGGLGGDNTALGVRVILHPCHIASLPVAVNIQCNSARRGEVVL